MCKSFFADTKILDTFATNKTLLISLFAEKLNFDRTNIYRIFNRKSIDTDLLFEISKVLEYDFFTLYSTPSCDK